MPACLEWAEERIEECNEWADQGHSECDAWRSECCDWWPCNWFCEIISWFCDAWVWIANVVCVGWTVITTAVCVVWDVVTTIINAILVTLESILGWILDAIAFIIELLEMIPILGTLIRWIINIVTHIINFIAAIGDLILGAIGIRPEKILRVCTVILRDETGTPTVDVPSAVTLLQLAANVYKRDANVRIIPLRPFKYNSGFSGAETVDASWVITDGSNSDGTLLDVPCEAGGEWLLTGSGFQLKTSTHCFFGAWRRVLGYGAPVTCFFIRSIPGNLGCSLWITDYVTIAGGTIATVSPRTLGHEAGHACNLWHLCVDNDNQNIMSTGGACNPASLTPSDRFNPRMDDGQALLVRASKHVTYF